MQNVVALGHLIHNHASSVDTGTILVPPPPEVHRVSSLIFLPLFPKWFAFVLFSVRSARLNMSEKYIHETKRKKKSKKTSKLFGGEVGSILEKIPTKAIL